MSRVVVDASTTLAWCFPDETSNYADGVLVALEGKTMLVPAVWMLESLTLLHDTRPIASCINDALPLARTHGLSAYDAVYLELSIRHKAPLATLDDKLRKAAKVAGVKIFEGEK